MKILALETTEKFGSVAVLEDRTVLGKTVLPKDRRSSQTLHPAMDELFRQTSLKPAEIEAVAVVVGPGSFTGLRVGITAAKIFAYSVGAKIVALDTFCVVAAGISWDGTVSIGVDAQRGDVVAGAVPQTGNTPRQNFPAPALMPIADWQKHAEQYENVLFAGPALERWRDRFAPAMQLADEQDWFPKAEIAGQLAADRLAAGQTDDLWTLLPVYSRLSAAEEKRSGK